MGPQLSVVIPCFNEEDCLLELYRRVGCVCRRAAGSDDYQLIFVNDGSTDATWQMIRELAQAAAIATYTLVFFALCRVFVFRGPSDGQFLDHADDAAMSHAGATLRASPGENG